MTMSTYSYNGSHIHLKLNDDIATDYNNAMKAWFQAQKDFERVHGRKITVKELPKMQIRATEAQYKAWNTVAQFINENIEKGLIVIKEEECTSSYLEKIK